MTEMEIPAAPEHAPPGFDLEKNNDYSKFLLYSKLEIVAVLRTLVQKGAMITAHFEHGKSFMLTSLIALSPDNSQVIFDVGSDHEMNSRALAANKLVFTAAVDKIKVQFSLNKLSGTTHDGRPAFRGTVPDTLLRLQRREYFRLSTPIATPIKCIIPMTRADGSALIAEAPLLDISGGGIGLMIQPEQASAYERGMTFKECKISLADEGVLITTLRVRNAFDVTARNGNLYVRVGCEFIELQGSHLTLIQRYITRTERDRKAQMSGMN